MDNPQIAVLAEKVETLTKSVDALRADLKPLTELVTRHDERLKTHSKIGGTLGAAFVAFVGGVLKTWLHI